MNHPWGICAPMRLEARALRRGLDDSGPPGVAVSGPGTVLRAGIGPRRAQQAARTPDISSLPALAVAGVCGGLGENLRPGDIVVADEVRADPLTAGVVPAAIRLPAAGLLAASLRRSGLTVHIGQIVSTDRVAHGTERDRLAATGALGADMESAWLLSGQPDRALACVRVVADTVPGGVLRPATIGHLWTALRALPKVATGLAEWAAATTVRRVALASPRSFCAGVERAIAIVDRALLRYGPPVYVRKQIVHNVHVVAELQTRGAVFVEELDEVPDGAVTVFSAHGVAPAVREAAAARGLSVIDGTCPLVTKVHSEARRYAARGDTVLLIGHADHEETEGTQGEAPDRVRLVQNAAEAERIEVDNPRRVSYLLQTTLAVEDASEVVDVLRRRFPKLAAPASEDICYATTNRQQALRTVAAESDVVLVLGSVNSSNSQRLVEVAQRTGAPAYLIDDAAGIDLRWLAGARTVGVTAGASAPPRLVNQVVAALGGLGAHDVIEHTETTEDVRFTLPKEVRPA